jgi:hypothetical protein
VGVVAVSALGDGGASGVGRGTAPAARLLFQSIENYVTTSLLCEFLGLPSGYYLSGLPADLGDLFQQAYAGGARVHSNSWGSASAGEYTTDSVNADEFVWSHRDMTVTFSAGNAGVDADADGRVDDSLGAPAGEERDQRRERTTGPPTSLRRPKSAVCAFQGSQNDIFTWWELWPLSPPSRR